MRREARSGVRVGVGAVGRLRNGVRTRAWVWDGFKLRQVWMRVRIRV